MLNRHSLQLIVNSFEKHNLPSYVVVATLYNELKATKRTALQLSICSKNARAITARAGDWGKSFSGVTSFIDESAVIMIALSDQIGNIAKGMTRESVGILLETQLAENLQWVCEQSLKNSDILTDLQKQNRQATASFHRQHDDNLRKLKRCLGEIKTCNRTLDAIVTICRTEATRAGPFQQSLWTIAESIHNAVRELNSQLVMGDSLMALISDSEPLAVSASIARGNDHVN